MKLPILARRSRADRHRPPSQRPPPHHAKAPAKHPPRAEGRGEQGRDTASRRKDFFHPSETRSTGTVTVGGQPIAYDAVAGTLVVHAKDWEDTDALEADADASPGGQGQERARSPKRRCSTRPISSRARPPRAGRSPSCSTAAPAPRPSGCTWARSARCACVTADARHNPPAPYSTVNNDQSLLDASDLVFIDAPGTGFSRIAGKDKEKAFYGVDQDIDAFTDFITQFLTKYGRWNSPKYVFGESYGTMRARGPDAGAAEGRRRSERRDPAVGHPQLGLHARRPAAQSGHRHALCRRAADLCGDGLVLQQGAEPAGRPARLPRPGRAVRDRRLCGGAAQGRTTCPTPSGSGSRSSSRPTPACRCPICSRPTSGSNMARSRRSCSASKA